MIMRALIGLTSLTWSGSEAGEGGPAIDLSWDDLTEVLSSESGMIMMGGRRDARGLNKCALREEYK